MEWSVDREYKMTDIRNGKFIDLFAGMGGFRRAVEPFGLKCVYSSEWDADAQQTYRDNFRETPDGDITKVDEKDIPAHNVLCAGFPCQAFSVSGKQSGFADARGTLFFDVARIARHHQPEVLFMENVRNLAAHDEGRTLKTITGILDETGYHAHHKVLNSSLYGVPTTRERIYFVCFRKDLGLSKFRFPSETLDRVSVSDMLLPDADTSDFVVKCKDAKIGKTVEEDLFGDYPRKPVQIGKIGKGRQGERIYSPMAHAITFMAYGGGIAAKTGAYLINGRIRRLAPRECARIMGFPDEHVLPSSNQQAWKQIGNSVVVTVLKQIFAKVVEALEGKQ